MKQRNINLDLIRCFAVLFVISVHFFLNSGFYEFPCSGMRMLFMCILRTVFITCVPLFLMLTGYLMNKKELSMSYYKGIKKTYCIYVIVCIFCLLFRALYERENMGLRQMVLSIFDFSANNYSWYIEMYLGLYLVIPFLNLLWINLDVKKRRWFLITLLGLTTLPSMLNCWNFLPNTYSAIVPDYWEGLYPLTYYFLGAYLKDINYKGKVLIESVILIAMMFLFGFFSYYRSFEKSYEWIAYNSYQGIQVVIVSVLVFRILLSFPLEKCPCIIKKGIMKVSELSLGIYLSSVISDEIIYPILIERVSDVRRLDYFLIVVTVSFVMALIISTVAKVIYNALQSILHTIMSSKQLS